MEQRVEKQEDAQASKETEKTTTNPVLRMELTVGTMAIGLFIDLVSNGPQGMLGYNGASTIAIFAFVATFVWNMGVDTIVWVQKIKQEWAPYLPGGEQVQMQEQAEDPAKTRVLAPPVKQEYQERAEEERMPPLSMKPTTATTVTRNFDDEEQDILPRVIPQERRIDLTADLQIDKEDLVGKAIFICGIRRHGKTTLGARLAEQFGRHYIPMFIPCLEGDYLSLADVLPRAVVTSHSSMANHYSNYDFVPLDNAQAAYQLGYDILDKGYQVIFDMSPYSSIDQAIALEINVIRGMFHWANTHPYDRVPAYVFKDEAQRYLPQNLSDSVIADQTVLRELLRVYMDIIAIGGKRGIAPVILTQRIAQVNKKIMAQSEVFFLLRQTNDGDLDRCMEYVDKGVVTRDDISKFQPGEGIYIAYDGSQLVTHFKKRRSSDERSSTPKADAALRYKTMPIDHTMVTKRDNRTAVLPQMEEIQAEREPQTNPLGRGTTPRLSPELQEALDAYEPGMNYRELGEKLGVNKDTAGKRLAILKARGIID